jgi:tetratricopeptide (TPR) repeat protein
MKSIWKILASLAIVMFSAVSLNAQDVAAATELFNSGVTASNAKNYTLAIDNFNKALKMAEGLGEEGASIVKDSKDLIPKLYLYSGQDLAAAKKADESIVQLNKAVEVAKLYGNADVEKEATALIPKVLEADAVDYLNNGMFPEAIEAYKKVIALNPNNGEAYLGMGVAESKLNNETGAIEDFSKAIELGDKENAPKQIANIYLKKASAAYSVKGWAAVLENAKKANTYSESSTALKLAGLAATNLKKYDDAITSLNAYLAAEPTAKDRDNMYYYLAGAYEAKANVAKACEFYKKIISNPTFKAAAEYKVNTQLKCK